jgi:hypothetical protein
VKIRALLVSSFAVLQFAGFPPSALAAGWVPVDLGPLTPPALVGVWGSSSRDVFAVGAGGAILHYDGMAWSAMDSGVTTDLWGVWGSSSRDVFAVGPEGTILHYDGMGWSAMESGTTTTLTAVWGSSPGDVFVTGTTADGLAGAVYHYDGEGWTLADSGAPDPLYGVWGSSASDVFVVGGSSDPFNHTSGSVVRRFDGAAWATQYREVFTCGDACVSSGELMSAWGSSPTDVFTVGLGDLILHHDGSAWTPMDAGAAETVHLMGVWGGSASDVFAVGWDGAIVHYDGNG